MKEFALMGNDHVKSEGLHINNIFGNVIFIKFVTTLLFKLNQCINNFQIRIWKEIYQKLKVGE